MTYTLYTLSSTSGGESLQAILAKESIADLISNLFPLDYPIQQFLGREPMSDVWKEFPVDTFAGITRTAASVAMGTAAIGAGALDSIVKPESHTPTDDTDTYEHKIRAVSELHVKSFSVSGTARANQYYGITDPYTYRTMKAAEEMASDFELRFWHGRGTTPGGGVIENFATGAAITNGIANTATDYPRQTQGLFNWIVRSGLERTVSGTGATAYNAHGELLKAATLPGNFQSYAYDLNGVNLTRDAFRYKLMQPWNSIGGRPNGCVMWMGGRVKGLFSDFALSVNGAVNQRNIPAESKTIIDTVDVYQTDYGQHFVNYCRYLDLAQSSIYNTTSAGSDVTVAWDESLVAVMPEYWKIGVYRGVGFTPLAKTGDFDRGMLVGEMGLICKNPIAGAALVNCIA